MIKVFFRDEPFSDNEALTHVANVETDDLEDAWEKTNNIEGSWSFGKYIPGYGDNPDYSPLVEVVAPLPVNDMGETRGHRSAMVGDIFVKGGVKFKVAAMGFEEVE